MDVSQSRPERLASAARVRIEGSLAMLQLTNRHARDASACVALSSARKAGTWPLGTQQSSLSPAGMDSCRTSFLNRSPGPCGSARRSPSCASNIVTRISVFSAKCHVHESKMPYRRYACVGAFLARGHNGILTSVMRLGHRAQKVSPWLLELVSSKV